MLLTILRNLAFNSLNELIKMSGWFVLLSLLNCHQHPRGIGVDRSLHIRHELNSDTILFSGVDGY